ncbi:hypothetical protein ABZX77_23965 [Streptomyces sp. NPDC004237]
MEKVFAHQPAKRRRHCTSSLGDGSRLLQVTEIRDGLIAHHRVY